MKNQIIFGLGIVGVESKDYTLTLSELKTEHIIGGESIGSDSTHIIHLIFSNLEGLKVFKNGLEQIESRLILEKAIEDCPELRLGA